MKPKTSNPDAEVSYVMKVTAAERDRLQRSLQDNGYTGKKLGQTLLKWVEREPKYGEIVFTFMKPAHLTALLDMLGDKSVGRFLEDYVMGAPDPAASPVGDVPFTDADLAEFNSICEELGRDRRYAFRQCITALRMRRI